MYSAFGVLKPYEVVNTAEISTTSAFERVEAILRILHLFCGISYLRVSGRCPDKYDSSGRPFRLVRDETERSEPDFRCKFYSFWI